MAVAACASTPTLQCEKFFSGWNVAWMAVYNNYTSSGTAVYYPNGTLTTWLSNGQLANAGTWNVTTGPDGWCYELEQYTIPKDSSDTCNTFRINPDTSSIVGCEVFGDSCFASCEGDRWTNWYAARLTEPIPAVEDIAGTAP